MQRLLASLTFGILCLFPGSSLAAKLRIDPPQVVLSGKGETQRLVVVLAEAGEAVGDRTKQAKFTSSNPAIVIVDSEGTVQAVAEGDAKIQAQVEGQSATVSVKVSKAIESSADPFRNLILPMMTKSGCNSGACHGALAGKGGLKLSLRGYDPDADHFALTRQARGRRIDCQEPHRSLMLQKATLAMSHGGGRRVEPGSSDYHLLTDWIAAGAPGPKPDGSRIQRLEVFPSVGLLQPKDTMSILVRAWYSDGTARDVTRWAKFNSSEDLVAAVDPEGRVSVAGHGEAAITVWYSDLVAAARVTVPHPGSNDPKIFGDPTKTNKIDELILKKLRKLNIPPSPKCSDEEFIRRTSLDTAGVLPTPEEVKAFVEDRDPHKRAKWIDRLLERPEYVDFWTYKWSDLLLITSRRLPQPAVWSFHQFVRQAVATNRPWDRFAREILTANGSNLQNGAANYYVLHKDISDLTESTAITFLGTSITCARCHNHPLEKWTQDQYWAMANLFGRLALKNGDRTGEVLVQVQPTGEVPHLRRGVPMAPAPLDGKSLSFEDASDRRRHLADWLTSPENPFFARALVNRVWKNYMGRGLVEAEDDLRATNPPTNAELLDFLAKDFVDHQFDVKYLTRTILNSSAYQLSSKPLPGNVADDRFYSHYLVRRLSSEVLLDAYSQVTGVPTLFTQVGTGSGGLATYTGYPRGTRAQQLPDSLVVSRFLDAFGRPERAQTCSCERQQDASVAQALHVNNGKTLNEKLQSKEGRIEAWLKENIGDEEAVRRVFRLALSREPTLAEMGKFKGFLSTATADSETGRRGALEDLFWSVLSSTEFAFNR